MALAKFNNNVLIRAVATTSILIGIVYMPSIFNFSIPIIGLGPELTGGQKLAELWAMYAVYGGAAILCGSFLMNITRSIVIKRIVLIAALIAMFLLVAAQLPPLFWWIYIGGAVFSWSSTLAFFLHLFLLVLALWGAFVTIFTIDRLKISK